MARKPRVHYSGALYHVVARGNNRMKVLLHNKEKQSYLELIKKYRERYDFKLYAYCLMDNHVHLVIQVDVVPLSKIMQCIQQVFTQRYNKINERTGHVFEQRYKAILCSNDVYLLNLIRYIHQNPIRAGITKDINYKWSSHNDYMGKRKDLVDIDFPLSLFGRTKKEAISMYNEFIVEKEELDEERIRAFENEKKEEISQESKDRSIVKNKVVINELLEKIITISEISYDELISGLRTKHVTDTRKAIVVLGKKYGKVSNKELSKLLNISETAVSKIVCRKYKETQDLKELIEKAEKLIC